MVSNKSDPRKGPTYVVFSLDDTDVLVQVRDAERECLGNGEVEAIRRAVDAVRAEAGDLALRGDELGPTVEAAMRSVGYVHVNVLYTGCMCHIYL